MKKWPTQILKDLAPSPTTPLSVAMGNKDWKRQANSNTNHIWHVSLTHVTVTVNSKLFQPTRPNYKQRKKKWTMQQSQSSTTKFQFLAIANACAQLFWVKSYYQAPS